MESTKLLQQKAVAFKLWAVTHCGILDFSAAALLAIASLQEFIRRQLDFEDG